MLNREVGPYKKPRGLLLDRPAKRLTKKSQALRRIERKVRENAALEQKIAAANRVPNPQFHSWQLESFRLNAEQAAARTSLPEANWRKKYPGIFHSAADLAEENKNFTLVFDALRGEEK